MKFLVVDMTPVVRSDSSGAHFIHDLAKDLKAKGIQLVLCNPTDVVRECAERDMSDRRGAGVYFAGALTLQQDSIF